MRKRPTFAQIEMAKMRKRREAETRERQERVRQRREYLNALEYARAAEATAVKLAASGSIKRAVERATESLAQDAAKIVTDQMSRLTLDVQDNHLSDVKVVAIAIPERRFNVAVSNTEIELERWR